MAKADKDADTKSEGGLWETVKTIFWALVIAGAFRTILFQPFSIPSGSMKPELLIGDYLFVSKFAYGYSRYSMPFEIDFGLLGEDRIWSKAPERGDVVVFKHPLHDQCARNPLERVWSFVLSVAGVVQVIQDDCQDYVKRVVGLPGDQVQVRAGVLHINGEALQTARVEDFVEPRVPRGSPPRYPNCVNGPVPPGGTCLKEQFVETFPSGRTHRILNIEGPVGEPAAYTRISSDNTIVFEVPEGHFFFMGDNRDNSIDSRFNAVGYVPFENLIGRADLIAISSDGPFWQIWNWRFDRMFTSID